MVRATNTKSKVPQLRFSEFGAEWTPSTFGEEFHFLSTNSLSRDMLNDKEGEVKNIHYGDIHSEFEAAFDIEVEHVPFIDSSISLKKIPKERYVINGDVIFADASEDYNDIGKSIEVINISNQKLLSGLHTLHGRKSKKSIIPFGLASQLFQTWNIRHQLMIFAQGTKVLGLSAKNISPISFYVPAKAEGEKILEFLSLVDKKISLLKQKHEQLVQYKKGIIQQLFSQQLRFKDDNGKDFPDWKKNRLDYLLERTSDPVEVGKSESYRQIGIRSHGKGIFHKEQVTGEELGDKRVFWVHTKAFVLNIVFAWEHAVAVTSENEGGMIASHRFPMYIPKDNRVDLDFMGIFFLRPRGKYLLGIASPGGAGRNKTLGQSNFAELKVTLPCLEEQKKIATFVKSIDQKINLAQQQVEQTQAYKKGLLQQMFV